MNQPRNSRKGNALLLVSGLLVMLTLIAAAYLSRTRAQRTTAAAIHDTAAEASRASMIAQQLASDVSQHLFLRPVDPNSAGAGIFGGNSFAARRNPSPYDTRYGIDGASTFVGANGRGDMLSDSITPRAPLAWTATIGNRGDGWPDGYNFAPYSVMPWTNWPDHLKPVDLDAAAPDPETNRFFPYLAPLNSTFGIPAASTVASNPIGNPGFGDTRWLRSTEPVRLTQWTLKQGGSPSPVPDGAFFSHWAHLSFPATANNGWRVIPDIGDIEGHTMVSGELATGRYAPGGGLIGAGTFVGGAVSGDMSSDRDGLGTPYEQWIPQLRPTPIAVKPGAQPTDNDTAFVADFARRRNLWFQRTGYLSTVGNGTVANMLPNLFKLDDPLGVGRAFDPGATPVPVSDEFVENSPRNIVSRTFADADGDGWTDSFWFLAPVGQEKNVRTVVGVSIVDNAGMIDVNVATRGNRHTTIGFTPADLALVTAEPEGAYLGKIGTASEPSELSSAPWTDTRVGLFDSPRNFARGRFSAGDPKVAATNNPAGTNSSLYDETGFEQGFDAYRWAGRPTPMIPGSPQDRWSWSSIDSGEPTFLSALGLWYAPGGTAKPRSNHWNGYVHTAPRSADRDPLDFTPPRIDLVFSTLRDSLQVGPWQASAPPGTASRWSQSEPLFATYLGDPTALGAWSWQSWLDASFRPSARPPVNAPNFEGAYPGSPFMRPEERTRWFRAAVSGELIAYGPFPFMGIDHVANGWRDATNDLRLASTGTRDFLGESIPFRPFDASDEVELRAYAGLNDPGAITRLERALNGDSLSRENSTVPDTLLRSSVLAGEAGKAGAQLTSAQWVKDLRRKITTISGQRNELMPPHLWVGRNFIALSRFIDNPYEAFQNANLWMDLHPQVPGPVDEDGDGVISITELQWGSYDLMRVTTSDDPFPDGIKITAGPSPVLSPSDWSRGVSLFEYMNRKFDLRQPLLIQRRLSQSDLEQIPSGSSPAKPYTNEFGLVDEQGFPKLVYAYSVQEQRRAMIDFALNARQRLRPALRTVSPQRQRTSDANPFSATLRDLGPRQAATGVDGDVNVAFASYTDRFLDQLRFGLDARVAGAVEPKDRVNMLTSEMKGLSDLGDLAWRSAWSTEALTASFAANLATWRSRPDLIRERSSKKEVRELPTDRTPLRPVWQPILPWQESSAAQLVADGNPYVDPTGKFVAQGVEFSSVKHRPDFGDTPVPTDVTRRMREFASPQALRAVDPSRPSKVANADWGKGLPNAEHPAKSDPPTEDSADLVFPGNEKHPFLAECFFGWVYPATTVTTSAGVKTPDAAGRLRSHPPTILPNRTNSKLLVDPAKPTIHPADSSSLNSDQYANLTKIKFVAVVNGQVGRPRLVPDPSDPRSNPMLELWNKVPPELRDRSTNRLERNLIPTALAMDYSNVFSQFVSTPSQPSPVSGQRPGQAGARRLVGMPDKDGFRDELNEIRTPVLVVQVANPWNEPIRLADFRLNIFGNLYDFPDYELDEDGKVVVDASGEPVPLMLPPATEFQPATATVYLIADSVGIPEDMSLDLLESSTAQQIRYAQANENDLGTVATWDPLFRRRWLDYFDLYEYTDGQHLGRDANAAWREKPKSPKDAVGDVWPCGTPTRHGVWNKSTSPVSSCLFSQPTWLDDGSISNGTTASALAAQANDLRSRLSRSKLLNAMDMSDVMVCEDSDRPRLRRRDKNRLNDLWKFKYSLTPDALRTGIVLERILRDPSGRNTWVEATMPGDTSNPDGTDGQAFASKTVEPAESTIDRYRLSFWPLRGFTYLNQVSKDGQLVWQELRQAYRSTFPRDSREPSTVFPPRGNLKEERVSALLANQIPNIEPTTLVVDRFDADDDFNHWTTVVNGPITPGSGRAELPFESSRAAEASLPQPGMPPGGSLYGYPLPLDPVKSTVVSGRPSGRFPIGVTGTPIARPDDERARFFENPHLNQDRNLVTGGRFWTACAQITLPPTRHRWPDGRDRRMMGLEDAWAQLPANGQPGNPPSYRAYSDSTYFGTPNSDGAAPDPQGEILNPRHDAYWMQWRHLPSLPVTLGSTMMVNTPPMPTTIWELLSRLPSRVRTGTGDPNPVRLNDGSLHPANGEWPRQEFRLEYFVGDSVWKTEGELFPYWTESAPGVFSMPPQPENYGILTAQDLADLCTAYPGLDRDANFVPDELQKIFVGFDEPEGSAANFPPPTALSLVKGNAGDGAIVFETPSSNAQPQFEIPGIDARKLPPVRGLSSEEGYQSSFRADTKAGGEYSLTTAGDDRRLPFSAEFTYNDDGTFTETATNPDRSLILPGIILRTGNESRDYFTTWTRVARSWSRNYDVELVTRKGDSLTLPSGADTSLPQGRIQQSWDARLRPSSILARQKGTMPGRGITGTRGATYPSSSATPGLSIQELAARNLPLWTWERQIVTASSDQAAARRGFDAGRTGVPDDETAFDARASDNTDRDGNVKANAANLSAALGIMTPDRLAPRYAFAQRTEPDRCDRPVDMSQDGATNPPIPMFWRGDFRPIRQELIGYQVSRHERPSIETNQPASKDNQGSGSRGNPGQPTSGSNLSPRVWPEEIARAGTLIYRAPKWVDRNDQATPYFAFFRDPWLDCDNGGEAKDFANPDGPPLPPSRQGNPRELARASQMEYQWTCANNGEFLTANGDLFALEPAASTEDDRPWDPDDWSPDPLASDLNDRTDDERFGRWMHRIAKFKWLTRPVIAPLPDLIGLGWSPDGSNPLQNLDASSALPDDAYPELVMRKPTAFNCQTVIDDSLSRDVGNPPSSDAFTDLHKQGYRRYLYAKYADFTLDSQSKLVKDGVTRFVYPSWARPSPRPLERAMAGNFPPASGSPADVVGPVAGGSPIYRLRSVKSGSGEFFTTGMDLFPIPEPPDATPSFDMLYRVYMGDKGGRLVDHDGKMLVLDRFGDHPMRPALHHGDVLAAAGTPISDMQKNLCLKAGQLAPPGNWLMQGVWNTLDRNPHGGSLQMLHKDDDFEQLGELTDVFLWGPAYRVYSNPETTYPVSDAFGKQKNLGTLPGVDWSSYVVNPPIDASGKGPYVSFQRTTGNNSRGGWLRPTDLQATVNYYEQASLNGVPVSRGVNADGASLLVPPRLVSQCRATFAEIMTGRVPGFPVGEGPMVNRLQVDPPNVAFHQPATGTVDDPDWGKPIQMGGLTGLRTPYAPNVPWGMRVFDAFTLDGSGGVLRYDWRDQFAGRTVEMNASSSPVPGALALPASGFQTDVRPFEDSTGNAGNAAFNPRAQDGLPSTLVGFSSTRFTAARPAGALIPGDVYRDETIRQPTGAVSIRRDSSGSPVALVTRASMAQWEHDRSPSLSGGFQDRPVPGLVNVNTAPVEVMRALPHMTQLVYDDSGRGRFAGSLDFSLSSYASAPPFALGISNESPGGLAGSLPAVSGRSVLNTDAQYQNLSTNGDRGANPATKLADAISIYRDRLNPNVLLANTSASATDWFVRDTKDPMAPATAGNRLSPVSGNSVNVPDSFPIYPSYVDRGEGAGAVDLRTSSAIVGTGGGTGVSGAKRDPFWFVYFNRGMSAVPGVNAVGELLGMSRTTRTRLNSSGVPTSLPAATGFNFPDWQYDQSWSVQLAGRDPYRTKREDPSSGQGWESYLFEAHKQLGPDPLDARLSTDRQGVRTFEFSKADNFNNSTGAFGSDGLPDLTVAESFHVEPDSVAGDSEERNMLFKGISNMISTRSDVFTAYFRVKTVKQGPDGRWNAMDPETLLSEARYVMCIDRSKVNRPTDKPRIVYFTQVRD